MAAQRLDSWLRERFPGLSRRHVEEALGRGLVRGRDGRRLAKGERVGDEGVDVSPLVAHLGALRRGNPDLRVEVLVERADWVAVDKPPGVASHPLSLFDVDTISHWAFARWGPLQEEFPGVQPTVTPHRLDRGTSGVQVVARTAEAYGRWRARFAAGVLEKGYLAWCRGAPDRERYVVDWPLAHDPRDGRRMVALKGRVRYRPPVLPAHSEVRVVKWGEDCFLAEVTCRTGVTHQVRVHLAALGFPLYGDGLYDAREKARGLPWHCLRAVWIRGGEEAIEAPSAAFSDRPPAPAGYSGAGGGS